MLFDPPHSASKSAKLGTGTMSKRQVHVMCTPLVTGAPSAKEIASAIFSGTTPCASNVYEVRPQLPDYQAHFETRWMWGASARVSYLRTNTIPRISQGGEECMSRVFAIRQISMAKMEGGENQKSNAKGENSSFAQFEALLRTRSASFPLASSLNQ